MRFGSKFKAFQVLVRPQIVQKNMVGDVISETKALVAEFAIHGGEFQVAHPLAPSGLHTAAGIRGHYFDSEEAQRANGWTDEERELVERTVKQVCDREPAHCWVIEDPKAPEPLPKWDQLASSRKLALASELGCLAEAVAWEAQNGTDPELLARLSKKLEAEQVPDVESQLNVA